MKKCHWCVEIQICFFTLTLSRMRRNLVQVVSSHPGVEISTKEPGRIICRKTSCFIDTEIQFKIWLFGPWLCFDWEPLKAFLYSCSLHYGHPLNTDISLLRTVCFVTGTWKPVHSTLLIWTAQYYIQTLSMAPSVSVLPGFHYRYSRIWNILCTSLTFQ